MLTRVLQTALQITVWEGSSIAKLTPFLPTTQRKNFNPWSINTLLPEKSSSRRSHCYSYFHLFLSFLIKAAARAYIADGSLFLKWLSSPTPPSHPLVCNLDNLLVLQNSAWDTWAFCFLFWGQFLPVHHSASRASYWLLLIPPGVTVSETFPKSTLSAFLILTASVCLNTLHYFLHSIIITWWYCNLFLHNV